MRFRNTDDATGIKTLPVPTWWPTPMPAAPKPAPKPRAKVRAKPRTTPKPTRAEVERLYLAELSRHRIGC